jgi:hypothetical protein
MQQRKARVCVRQNGKIKTAIEANTLEQKGKKSKLD